MRKINEWNILGINVQIVVTVIAGILGILSVFFERFFPFFQLAMGIDMFLLAFNNSRVYRRKNLTIIYIVCGILLILFSILIFFGVI